MVGEHYGGPTAARDPVPSHGRARGEEARVRWHRQARTRRGGHCFCSNPSKASDGGGVLWPRAWAPVHPTAARVSRSRALQHVWCGRAGGAHLEREEVGSATPLVAKGGSAGCAARVASASRGALYVRCAGNEAATGGGSRPRIICRACNKYDSHGHPTRRARGQWSSRRSVQDVWGRT